MKNLITKIGSHTLAKGSILVFIGAMVSNVGAYVYHLLMGRILGPTGYGELSSLISLLYIFGVPTTVLQTVLVKFFSGYKAKENIPAATYLFRRINSWLVIVFIPISLVVLGLSPFIANFLHIENIRMIVWVLCILILSTFIAVNGSAIQGFQLFFWLSILTALTSMLKVGISIPMAFSGVEMAILASVVASGITYALYFIPIRFLLRTKPASSAISKKDFLRYSIPTFLTLLSMTSLYSMDIVLAKHFFSAHDAGIYSAIAVLGKIIFYASSAIGTVLFPIVSERYANKKDISSIVTMGIGIVGIASACVAAIYFFFPLSIVHLLFGVSYDEAARHLGFFAAFISLYSLANILITTCLAVEKTNVFILTTFAALIQILLLSNFNSSILSFIYINIAVTACLLIGVFVYFIYGQNKHYHTGV